MATGKCKGVGVLEWPQVSGAAEQAASAPVPVLPIILGGAANKEDRPTKVWLMEHAERWRCWNGHWFVVMLPAKMEWLLCPACRTPVRTSR
jgi:hypothetical protein